MEGYQSKPMIEVNEVCAKCSVAITQLPFTPDPARKDQLKCKVCWREERDAQSR